MREMVLEAELKCGHMGGNILCIYTYVQMCVDIHKKYIAQY